MRVISAIYNTEGRDYDKLLNNLKKSVMAMQYPFCAYQLSEDPIKQFHSKGTYNAPCYFKPVLIKKALEEFKEDIVWLDADCLLNRRIDEILDRSDVTVTMRRFQETKLRNLYDGYINAGVLAFRYNSKALEFISKWIELLPTHRADQDALASLLLKYDDLYDYGKVFEAVGGAKVKLLSCNIYNFFYFDDEQIDYGRIKIFHIKGHLREQHYEKVKREVLNG